VKIIRNVLLVIALAVVACFGLIFYSFSRTIPLKDRQPLSGGAEQVKDGMVSVGIIPSAAGQVILVDCGNDRKAKAILDALKQMGLGREAVKTILLTHAHADHIAGCAVFPDAEVFAMAAEQSLLEGRTAARILNGEEKLWNPRRQILAGGRSISTGQRHGDCVPDPRAYRRQRGLPGRGDALPRRQRRFR